MSVRRPTVLLRHAVPPATVLPYAAALVAIVVLAALLSFGARRVMQPWTARVADSGGALASATLQHEDVERPAQARTGRANAAKGNSAEANTAQANAQKQPAPPNTRQAAGASATAAALPPAIEELRRRRLSLPVNGVTADQLVHTFDEARGDRPHEAIDILAARGTPVVATEDGRVAKLFWSKAGGHTIYQFDPSERYVYYYAHLDRYADALTEGQTITRGQTIGYVGSTGNAKADAPHLHFAIFLLTPEKRWWDGAALDPYPVLRWNIDGGTP
jgi:peptidoglycan LD-endopeptidase LytH